MDKKTIAFPESIIQHYLKVLRAKIQIDGVLLFGSFAWGVPTKHSDVDLVVISPDFSRKNFSDRLSLLSHARDKTTYQIAMDIVGYTPEEFSNIEQHSAIIGKAKRDGKWIYQKK